MALRPQHKQLIKIPFQMVHCHTPNFDQGPSFLIVFYILFQVYFIRRFFLLFTFLSFFF